MEIQVTLIFTQHIENGTCSSNALLQWIEAVKPEVIFEELSLENYRLAYEEMSLTNLESVAIRKYLASQAVEHIPVDTYEFPKDYYKDLGSMYDRLTSSANEHSFGLRSILDQQKSLVYQYGFHFLNNPQNELLFEEIESLKEKALNMLNDDWLFRIARAEKECLEKREDVILDNIFRYCVEKEFSKGLMFIGSGHQKSIKKKIQERIAKEETKINWRYFQDLISPHSS